MTMVSLEGEGSGREVSESDSQLKGSEFDPRLIRFLREMGYPYPPASVTQQLLVALGRHVSLRVGYAADNIKKARRVGVYTCT
jgi:hypothetical protein